MNRFRVFVAAALVTAALSALAQQNVAATPSEQSSRVSKVDQHLQFLAQKLDLTSDQQTKMKPILQQMFDGQLKLMRDKNLSDDERDQKMKLLHESADGQARQFLNDDQKKKLDELEAQPHHDSHAN